MANNSCVDTVVSIPLLTVCYFFTKPGDKAQERQQELVVVVRLGF
jgi:hypothetical protein